MHHTSHFFPDLFVPNHRIDFAKKEAETLPSVEISFLELQWLQVRDLFTRAILLCDFAASLWVNQVAENDPANMVHCDAFLECFIRSQIAKTLIEI
jgi:hypothetical protein